MQMDDNETDGSVSIGESDQAGWLVSEKVLN